VGQIQRKQLIFPGKDDSIESLKGDTSMSKEEVNITASIPKATEIAFCFDTTGSMQPCIANVRKHIEKTCEELFKDIPGLKVGFISHGDYCDDANTYDIQKLTDDEKKVYQFIRNTPNTGGGDSPECYELALNLAKGLGWTVDKKNKGVLVMIGDAEPHDVNYPQNKDKLDWEKEVKDLMEMGINVYPLQCLYQSNAKGPNEFWAKISEICDTPLLKLQNFDEAHLAVRSYAHASGGSARYAAYEKKLVDEGVALSPSIMALNTSMRSESPKYDVIEEITSTSPPTSTSGAAKLDTPKKPRGRPKKEKNITT
jgi:hypothetical protein